MSRSIALFAALAAAPCDRDEVAPQQATLDQYVEADEIAAARSGGVMQVHGYVEPGSVVQGPDGAHRFRVVRRKGGIDVTYRNVLPDRFQEKLEVIVTGKLLADGSALEGTDLVAKCPSDYESLPQWTSDAAP